MTSAIAAAASSRRQVLVPRQLLDQLRKHRRQSTPSFEEVAQDACGPRPSGSTRDETARRAPASVRCRRPMIDAVLARPRATPRARPAARRRRRRASDSATATNGPSMPGEDAAAVVLDRRRLAVHRRAPRARPSRRTRRRSPGARGRRRESASSRPSRRITLHRDARRPPGRPGPGEITMRSGRQRRDRRRRVTASLRITLHVGAELAQVLHEVVGERIVVVDDEDHGSQALPARARARAAAPAPCRASPRTRPSDSSP